MPRYNFAGIGAGLGQGLSQGLLARFIEPRMQQMKIESLLKNAKSLFSNNPELFGPDGNINPKYRDSLLLASGQFGKPVDPMQQLMMAFLSGQLRMPEFGNSDVKSSSIPNVVDPKNGDIIAPDSFDEYDQLISRGFKRR